MVWSFGNSQKNYLFGKHLEENKRLLHEVVVNSCEASLKAINDKLGTSLTLNDSSSLFDVEDKNTRRLRIATTATTARTTKNHKRLIRANKNRYSNRRNNSLFRPTIRGNKKI